MVTTASWIERLAAFALDAILAFMFIILVLSLVPAPQFQNYTPDQIQLAMEASFSLTVAVIGWTIVINLLFFSYFVLTQFYLGRTLGMMLFRLRLDCPEYKRLSRILINNLQLLVLLPHIPGYFLVSLVDVLWVAFSKKRERGLHVVTQSTIIKTTTNL